LRRKGGLEVILKAENLTKAFGGLLAVNDVSLEVEEKELSSIIGTNGAGKTTLFNLLTGDLQCDSGKVIFDGEDITNIPPYQICRKGIGRSFQVTNIFPRLSTFENIQVAVLSAQRKSSRLFSPSAGMARKETNEILESIGLSDQKEMLGSLLSHGDRRRLDIGIALASHPRLLLLDEPTAGMSPKESVEITELIQKLAKERHLSILFIEHDMSIVFDISEKIRVMHQGRIFFEGTPEEVKANDRVQEIYLGEES